jgi:hypothetical protein
LPLYHVTATAKNARNKTPGQTGTATNTTNKKSDALGVGLLSQKTFRKSLGLINVAWRGEA